MFDSINPIFYLSFPIVVFSLCVHECAHALTAYWGGDDTARLQGRITLNPVSHVDPIGTLILPIFAMLSGFPIIGWARPVPVNLSRLKKPIWDPIVTLAGPMSNFMLAILAALIGKIISLTVGLENVHEVIPTLIVLFIAINTALGIFNLIPIPPLDGSRLLFYFVIKNQPKLYNAWMTIERYSFIFLYLIIIIKPTKIFLFTVISVVSGALINFIR